MCNQTRFTIAVAWTQNQLKLKDCPNKTFVRPTTSTTVLVLNSSTTSTTRILSNCITWAWWGSMPVSIELIVGKTQNLPLFCNAKNVRTSPRGEHRQWQFTFQCALELRPISPPILYLCIRKMKKTEFYLQWDLWRNSRAKMAALPSSRCWRYKTMRRESANVLWLCQYVVAVPLRTMYTVADCC